MGNRFEAWQQPPAEQHKTPPQEKSLPTVKQIPTASFYSAHEKMAEAVRLYGKAFMNHWTRFWQLTAEGSKPLAEHATKSMHNNEYMPADIETIQDMGRAGMAINRLVLELTESMTASWMQQVEAESGKFARALETAVTTEDWASIDAYWTQWVHTLENLLERNPAYLEHIRDTEYGYRFENEREYERVAETGRAILYRLQPLTAGVETDMTRKPIIIISPFLLGDNISALLPRQGISYAHAFANTGAPTYVVHYKEILETPAVQTMTGEDFTEDLRSFTERVQEIHGQKVTLNGICQGGYLTLSALLTGKLDPHVDSLMTCVMPVDLSQCEQFTKLREGMPKAMSDVEMLAVTLPNGNRVIPGETASTGMRWKNLARENPIASFNSEVRGAERNITDLGAAVKIWLGNYAPMPIELVRLSERSASEPLSPEGDLPISLFGENLNLKHLKDSGIQWHALIGGNDDVVDLTAATAARAHLGDYDGYTEAIAPAGHISFLTNPIHYPMVRAGYERWDKEARLNSSQKLSQSPALHKY